MGAAKNPTNMVQPCRASLYPAQGLTSAPQDNQLHPQQDHSSAGLQLLTRLLSHDLICKPIHWPPSQPSLVLFLITALMLGSRAAFLPPVALLLAR